MDPRESPVREDQASTIDLRGTGPTSAELDETSLATITLGYYDDKGRLIDSEDFQVPPAAGSVWIKPSARILAWPMVRTVRASLARTPLTPVDMVVHLLQLPCDHHAPDRLVRAEPRSTAPRG